MWEEDGKEAAAGTRDMGTRGPQGGQQEPEPLPGAPGPEGTMSRVDEGPELQLAAEKGPGRPQYTAGRVGGSRPAGKWQIPNKPSAELRGAQPCPVPTLFPNQGPS